tara:strand:- start:392 stop:598 length:207 start_codon:yes stop_codon:yes gene_type:complete
MKAKDYCDISAITYKIQDLADQLATLGFESDRDDLYRIAQGIQDYRDLETGDLTDEQIEAEWKTREEA